MQDGTVKPIAFYLPQFYRTAENDEWWGKGFTEWRSAATATPLFEGQHQPQLPADLGFHTQTDVQTLRAQIDLATANGIHGFCHYYYWFDGHRLLNKPTELMLDTPDLDMPFCLCWANEHWTRRWDGKDEDVLMPQSYDLDRYDEFAEGLIPYFSDSRYICADDKPVFLIYRAQEVPNLSKLCAAIRQSAKAAGRSGAYILGAETFVNYGDWTDPTQRGLDGAVEFPPHGIEQKELCLTEKSKSSPKFAGHIFSGFQVLMGALRRARPSYPLHRTVFPSWDNTARLDTRANIFVGTSPKWFGEWFSAMFEWTKLAHPPSQQFLFVNAWNEWAEGAHLEPDLLYGSDYLEVVKSVTEGRFMSNAGIDMNELYAASKEERNAILQQVKPFLQKNCAVNLCLDNQKSRMADVGRPYDSTRHKYLYTLILDERKQVFRALLRTRNLTDFRRVIGNALQVPNPSGRIDRFRNSLFQLIHNTRRMGQK